MIDFRCWFCHKRYSVAESRIGKELLCTCQRRLRVPRRSGGYCRVKTAADWAVEALVYGTGGLLLGLGLGLLMLRATGGGRSGLTLLVGMAAAGFLAGLFGGEPGVNWVGRMIREREEE